MKKLRMTMNGKSYDVTVQVLEDDEPPSRGAGFVSPLPDAAAARLGREGGRLGRAGTAGRSARADAGRTAQRHPRADRRHRAEGVRAGRRELSKRRRLS
jgi:hypothetical protein